MNRKQLIGLGFLEFGLVVGVFSALIPFISKASLSAPNAQAIVAFTVNLSSLLGILLSKRIRRPTSGWYRGAVLVLLTSLVGLMLSDTGTFGILLCLVVMLGLGCGLIEVLVNTSASELVFLQKEDPMPSMHARFSLGSILGGVFVTIALARSVTPEIALIAPILMAFVVLAVGSSETKTGMWGQSQVDSRKSAGHIAPWLPVMVGFVSFSVILVEVTLMQWSALLMRDKYHAPAAYMSAALVAFSLLSFIVRWRFSGVAKLGLSTARWIYASLVLSAVLIIMLSFAWQAWQAFILIALLGATTALAVPLCFSIASTRLGGGHLVVSTISLMGYSALIVSPLLVRLLGFEKGGVSVFHLCNGLLVAAIFALWTVQRSTHVVEDGCSSKEEK